MIKVEQIGVWGFEHAIRGMRNPMNSWEKSDSKWQYIDDEAVDVQYVIGENDMKLMKSLFRASLVGDNHAHRKFLRQIMVSMDITAPLYWWKEFDTYKVGTVSNSCSTMHKIHSKRFEPIDFSIEHLNHESMAVLNVILAGLNVARDRFLETKSKDDWWQMIQLLPTSYNQKRTVTMNYEVAYTICTQRLDHKLDEWREFCDILLKTIPYLQKIITSD